MGNMKGWGGPLSDHWHQQQIVLQHKILARMRALGMTPVLPAFAGHVPDAITRLYPKVKVQTLPDWAHFNKTYCW
jgi:alpha-N-acetylglucosaminidase